VEQTIRLSARAEQAVALAENEARRYGHSYLGTEHLLLGLLEVRDGAATRILADLGADPTSVRSAIEFRIAPGTEPPEAERSRAPRLEQALARATAAALEEGAVHIGTEHLLFGLASIEECVAARTLVRLDVELAHLRRRTLGVSSQRS
jgi:ATP-dependent Clp protease ATP-binding subunit ClpC